MEHDANPLPSPAISTDDVAVRALATTAPPRATPGQRIRAFFRSRRRILIATFLLAAALAALGGSMTGASAGTPEASLARAVALAEDGLEVDPTSIVWLAEDDGPLHARPALFLAHTGRELDDVYYAEARPTSDGGVLDVAWITNVTRTSGAAEQAPMRLGNHVVFASKLGDRFDAVSVLDIRGEADELTRDWPLHSRWQNAITNAQETGRRDGFGRRRYQLLAPSSHLGIASVGGRVLVDADERRFVIDPARARPVEGASLVSVSGSDKVQPGTIGWAVDTVRNVSWIGPGPIEWLEHAVYGVKDRAQRAYHSTVGTSSAETAAEVADDLTVSDQAREQRELLTATDPELGWPPARLPQVLTSEDAVQGEGEWLPVVDDPFVRSYANAPPAFYQTFVRVDPERLFTRVYVTLWDPRQVQLRVVMGTQEPESATGENGTGMIPRDPETSSRLLAGFNGGFQAIHGEFGMMADGRVYLPPKPWAATVAVFDDGRVGMGSWPAPANNSRTFDERTATATIPEGLVEMRQNLTSVVEDGVYNPWQRWWWGSAPEAATEQTFIDRSGICLTREGFMAYFWGKSMGAEQLGKAMIAARCARGVHLDQNNIHTGLEFYNITPRDAVRAPIGRALRDGDEYDGRHPDLADMHLRARRSVGTMSTYRFPRYVRRDARDFFYLTQRPVLPGPDLALQPAGQGRFTTTGLPHAGWPHAFARTSLGEPAARTWIVRIDPSRGIPGPLAETDQTRRLAVLTNGASLLAPSAARSIYAEHGTVGWHFAIGAPPPRARVVAAGADVATTPDARAALGVDRDGFLVYVEATTAQALADALTAAGVAGAIALPERARLCFVVGDDAVTVAGARAEPFDAAQALTFVANERSAASVIFPDTQPVRYRVWGPVQDQRVRYLRENRPFRFLPPPDARH